MDGNAAFYAQHYPDWTVHELPLTVYVPMKDSSRDEALALVREILDQAAFDIRVTLAAQPSPASPDTEGGADRG